MNDNYTLEELEAYLYGELDPEKTKEIEEKIKIDLSLQKELSALKISREAVELAGWKSVIAQSQSEYLAEREQEKVIPIQTGPSQTGLWLRRLAASVALILVGSFSVLFFSTSTQSIIDNQVDYALPVMRSSGDQVAEVEKAYQSGDFIRVLELAKGITSYDSKTYLVIGLAHLEENQGEKAEQYLRKIESENLATSKSEFADQVDYYLVKAFLMQGKITEAEARMNKIQGDPEHTYHDNFGPFDQIRLQILQLKK